MKIHDPSPSELTVTFLQTFTLMEDQEKVAKIEDADVILSTDIQEVRSLYRPDKFFALIAPRIRDINKNQPDNVFILDAAHLFEHANGVSGLQEAFVKWTSRKKEVRRPAVDMPRDIVKFKRGYAVLIVDDNRDNLALAMHVLPGQQMAPVERVEDAVRLLRLEGRTFNAVLTDMHMRPDRLYGSLNLDSYGVSETIPYGFAVILEATKRGIPVAVVTDANHHADWVSAMFDSIKEANVNGQRVIFCNDLGKRWDFALKRLLEPDDRSGT